MDKATNTLTSLHIHKHPGVNTPPSRAVIHRLKQINGLGPLTLRSVIILGCLLYLLLGPVQLRTDIVAASLTFSLLAVIGIAAVAVVIQGALLRARGSLSISPPQTILTAGEPGTVVIRMEQIRILPLMRLYLRISFRHEGAPNSIVRVSGRSMAETQIPVSMTFPHRGSWDVQCIECWVSDIAGLSRFAWKTPLSSAVTVAPRAVIDSHLPIVSSTQRPGEMVVDFMNRQGDPFDIKAYHPSDGIKKIVWKTFAKRGELLSRHPEASMTPEGFVVLFVAAGVEGDSACAHAEAYARAMTRLNLDVIGSCLGGRGREIARSPEDLAELMIDSVWDAQLGGDESLQRDAAELIDYCARLTPSLAVKRLLIFTSAERLTLEGEPARLQALGSWLANQEITPLFFIVPPSRLTGESPRSITDRIKTYIVSPEADEGTPVDARLYNQFLSDCLTRQWEVLVC